MTQDRTIIADLDAAMLKCTALRRGVGRPRVLEEHERRERILEAACEAFRSNGFHDASMDQIARASGMSKKTLYELFPSKQNLFEAAIEDRLFCTRQPLCSYHGSLEDQLSGQLTDIADIVLRDDRVNLMRAIISEIPKSAEIREVFTRLLEGKVETSYLSHWFRQQKDAGLIQIDDPDQAARYLFGMTVGELMMASLIERTISGPFNTHDFIRKGVQIFLRGINASMGMTAVETGPEASAG